jgi:hypothetical protein
LEATAYVGMYCEQNGQIGRIFAYWVFDNFGQVSLKLEKYPIILVIFFHDKSDAQILIGSWFAKFWAIFSQIHLVTLIVKATMIDNQKWHFNASLLSSLNRGDYPNEWC